MPSDGPFTLPMVDGSALAEAGVVLMGLDAERLLAGLGLAASDEDAGQVALRVDESRHAVAGCAPFEVLVDAGARRWHAARAALAAANRGRPASASLRQAWDGALAGVARYEQQPAVRAFLAACWLRREDVDRCAARCRT